LQDLGKNIKSRCRMSNTIPHMGDVFIFSIQFMPDQENGAGILGPGQSRSNK